MATKKKQPAKKTAGRKSSKKKSRSRAKKPKVKLDARKVLTLAAAIVTVCFLFLVGAGLVRPYLQGLGSGGGGTQETAQSETGGMTADANAAAGTGGSSSGAGVPSAGSTAGNAGASSGNGGTAPHADSASGNSASSSHATASSGNGSGSQSASAASANSATSSNASAQTANSNTSPDVTPSSSNAGTASVSSGTSSGNNSSVPSTDSTAGNAGASSGNGGSSSGAGASSSEKSPFTIPRAKNNARLAFVIDDAGLNVSNVRKYTELPFPITIAVLPKLSHSKDCAWVVRSSGKELILHQPMQSINLNINPGEGAIKPGMPGSEISSLLKENISEIGPGVKGFNNHEGSLITEDANKMSFVLGTAKELGVYFLDSRTTANSTARQAALEHDMRIVERNAPFLDNTVTREAMLAELYKGLDVANRDGYAVIIGHVDKSVNILPALLAEIYPYLVEAGYTFVTPGMLVQ